jgi:hypothetical protein
MPVWLQVVLALGGPIFAAGGAYQATRTVLRWHWSEIQRAHTRCDRHDENFQQLEWVRLSK